jgi:hypothetical protein
MRLRWWVLFSTIFSVISFGLLVYVVIYLWPDPDRMLAFPQLLFFVAWYLFLTTVSITVAAYLNYRFAKPGWLQRDKFRLLRQGTWVGTLGLLLAYLQLVRALSLVVGLVLVAAFFLIELFFLTRE